MSSLKGKIIVFARAPVPGQTKTRLIGTLGETGAALLHSKLILRTLKTASDLPAVCELHCTPDTTHPFFAECARNFNLPLFKQYGNDLGEKMMSAFLNALRNYDYAVLIGTDCPEMCREDILQAIEFLESGCDAVIGPALDGGYYLIGLRRTSPVIFSRIEWGKNNVYSATKQRLEDLGWSWRNLTPHRDLDRPEDFTYFLEKGIIETE